MEDKELLKMWNTSNNKLDEILSINRELVQSLTRRKLNDTINSLRLPKRKMVIIGIPYTILLLFVTSIAFIAEAWVVMFGFGVITILMVCVLIGYLYHLYLINKINRAEEVADVQRKIAKLKISSFNIARLSIIQLPFWSICWVSLDALLKSPLIYGGVNLLVFLVLSYLSFWMYKNLSIDNTNSCISKILLSGSEWEPLLKSADILDQLRTK